jgi:ribosomal protein S18 acetylase RimI-like enzyme
VHALLEVNAFTDERVGYMAVLVVEPAAAGRGVARALMTAAEDWPRDQACALMTLEVFASNTTARADYGRLGYAEQTLKLAKGPELAA